MNKPSRQTQQGYTVIELVMVIAIAGILVSVGVPNFNDSAARGQVVGAAEGIFGMVLQARSESSVRDADLSVNTDTSETPWCVGYSATPDCDCFDATSCVVDVAGTSVVQILNGANFPGVVMNETFATGGGTSFSRIRGSASQAGIISLTSGSWQLNVEVTADGRSRICNPNDAVSSIPGYGAC